MRYFSLVIEKEAKNAHSRGSQKIMHYLLRLLLQAPRENYTGKKISTGARILLLLLSSASALEVFTYTKNVVLALVKTEW